MAYLGELGHAPLRLEKSVLAIAKKGKHGLVPLCESISGQRKSPLHEILNTPAEYACLNALMYSYFESRSFYVYTTSHLLRGEVWIHGYRSTPRNNNEMKRK